MSEALALQEVRKLRGVLKEARRALKAITIAMENENKDTPRFLLTADQLQLVAREAMAGNGYAAIAKILGCQSDLYSALDETFRAAGCPGTRKTWGGAEALQRWVLSYGDAESAYAWHLAVARDREPR